MKNPEIPDTIQGLKLYISYCEKQIKENRLNINRLGKLSKFAQEKLNIKTGESHEKAVDP